MSTSCSSRTPSRSRPPQDRLFRLHLLELPLLLRWALHAVTPLLHPATRSKLVTSSISDPQLPVTVAFLTKRWVGGEGRGCWAVWPLQE